MITCFYFFINIAKNTQKMKDVGIIRLLPISLLLHWHAHRQSFVYNETTIQELALLACYYIPAGKKYDIIRSVLAGILQEQHVGLGRNHFRGTAYGANNR